MLNTPPDVESPEEKCARLQAELLARDQAIEARDQAIKDMDEAIKAKDQAINEAINQQNLLIKQLRAEIECQKMANRLEQTLNMARAREENVEDLVRHMKITINDSHN